MPLQEWLQHREVAIIGRHGMPAELVRENQRGRLLEAAARMTTEVGVARLTIKGLSKRAGVSRTTFYSLFDSKDECFLAAGDEALEQMVAQVRAVTVANGGTPRQILERTISTFANFCLDHPNSAHIGIVGLAGSGPEGAALRAARLDEMTALVRAPLAEAQPAIPDLTAETLVGGLWNVAGRRLQRGRARELPLMARHVTAAMLGELT